MPADIGRLKEIASSVRQILERYSLSTDDIMFQSFPRGCCGPASELLGRCLIELGFANVSYIAAERRDDTGSHAWINVDGVIVDITADQFGEPDVIVRRVSSWHAQWCTEPARRPICSRDQWPMYPQAAWQLIVDEMRRLETAKARK
jgi:hypothetical protein